MFYLALEKAINHILRFDPDTLHRLEKLEGKVIKLSLTDWRLDCYLFIYPSEVRISQHYQGLADTVIRGKLFGLVRAGLAGASGPALFDQGVEVEGDTELGEQIRDILRRVDLDTEEYLSRFVGDVAAHEIVWRSKRALKLGKQTWHELRENIREFCQVEAQYLPTRTQVEDFYGQVARLRDDVDRAKARLERLKSKIHK